MKNLVLITIFIALFIIVSIKVKAQNLLYHTLANDTTGIVLMSHQVSLRVSIMQGSLSSQVIYCESFVVTSDTMGIASFTFGTGTVVSGSLASVNWQANNFTKIEIDPAAGSNYGKMGYAIVNTTTHMLLPNLTN